VCITSWLTFFGQDPRFIQALQAILRLQAALVDNAAGSLRPGSAPVVFQLPASLVRHQRLATPAIIQYASLLTLLQRWFSATSSTAQRQLVDWPPTWSKTEVIKTRKHPDCYTRVTLKDKLAGANISVLHLYGAVREALTSGLLIVSPPFPADSLWPGSKIHPGTAYDTATASTTRRLRLGPFVQFETPRFCSCLCPASCCALQPPEKTGHASNQQARVYDDAP
jgi:hypothetical protein